MADRAILFAVDDEIDNLELISRSLSSAYDVKIFTDPAKALTVAKGTPPTAMVIDYRMPGINGIDLITQLRSAGVRCAVVMTTAYPDEDQVLKSEEERLVFRVLPKPWTAEDLKVLVDMAVRTSRVERATSRLEKATDKLGKK